MRFIDGNPFGSKVAKSFGKTIGTPAFVGIYWLSAVGIRTLAPAECAEIRPFAEKGRGTAEGCWPRPR